MELMDNLVCTTYPISNIIKIEIKEIGGYDGKDKTSDYWKLPE